MDLKDLTSLAGVAGNEDEVRTAIMGELDSMGVSYETDFLGNVIAKKGTKGPKVLVDAHMDEVGLLVVHVEKNGFLRFVSIGVPAAALPSKRILIGPDKVPGVIGAKAIHLQERRERESVIPTTDLYIDVGAKSKEEAERKVKVGDYAVFDTLYEELSPGVIKAKALDDRVGCALLLDILKETWEKLQLYAVFSAQEEVGTRGAKVAAYRVEPDMGIALEGTVCADIPGVEEDFQATRVGQGAVLSVMDRGTIVHKAMLNQLMKIASDNGIQVQFREATSGGNDAGPIHQAKAGCPTAVISIPCRYIHTPFSLMAKTDYDAALKLLTLFLQSVEGGFRP